MPRWFSLFQAFSLGVWLYLIIADAVPAAPLIRQSLQILDPELPNMNHTRQTDRSAQPTYIFPVLTTGRADEAAAALHLHVDAVLKAALRLRLHQPATVLWRIRWFRALFSCPRRFPFTAGCYFCRRDCVAVVIFACVVEGTIRHSLQCNTPDKRFYRAIYFAYLS